MTRGFRWALVGVVASLWGCSFGSTKFCSTNADCGTNGTCTRGVCVSDGQGGGGGGSTGGGTGGGATGGGVGGGGGGTGGGTAGGTGGGTAGGTGGGTAGGTGGGTAGGSGGGTGGGTSACSPACAAWEECAGTTCQSKYTGITWVLPAEGARSPDASVVLAVVLVLNDGGVESNAGADVSAAASLTDGGQPLTVALLQAGANQLGVATLTADGPWVAIASWPDAGLTSAPRHFELDRTGPTFAVDLTALPARGGTAGFTADDPSMDGGAFRRDEALEVRLSSQDVDVLSGSVSLAVVGFQVDGGLPDFAMTPVSCATLTQVNLRCAAISAPFCACYTLDLSKPAFDNFRDVRPLHLLATDTLGNPTVSSTPRPSGLTSGGTATPLAGLPITRWRWARTAGVVSLEAPAIDSKGDVVVGGALTTISGQLLSFTPAGAAGSFALTTFPSINQPIVIGAPSHPSGNGQLVYVAATDVAASALFTFKTDGTLFPDAGCQIVFGGTFTRPMALVDSDAGAAGPWETLVATLADADGGLVQAARPLSAEECLPDTRLALGPSGTSTVGGTGNWIFWGDSNGEVGSSVLTSAGATTPVMAPPFAGFSVGPLELVPLASSGLAVLGTVSSATDGGVFALDANGMSLAWAFSDATFAGGTPAGAAVIGSGAAYYGSSGAPRFHKLPLAAGVLGAPATTEVTANPSNGTTAVYAPALGADGTVYQMATNFLYARANDLSPRWRVALSGNGGPLTLDCARTGAGATIQGRPGTLYLASGGLLTSIIVDSPGLDSTAPWPVFQHDPRNTGSPDTPLTEWDCR